MLIELQIITNLCILFVLSSSYQDKLDCLLKFNGSNKSSASVLDPRFSIKVTTTHLCSYSVQKLKNRNKYHRISNVI